MIISRKELSVIKILDACCGSKLFWFDKQNDFATYMDIREESYEICGKKVNVKPDVVADFRNMPFEDNTYDLVVFDPPHLKWAGQKSIMKAQYGQLNKDTWPDDIKRGMTECLRVLKPTGTLIFKWNENQVKLKEVLKAIEPISPLFGNRRAETHWLVFMKGCS